MRGLSQKYEAHVRKGGFSRICGVDEVGRGAWAGPILAAGVIFDEGVTIKGLHDSKKLTPLDRERLYEKIHEKASALSVQLLDSTAIDKMGVGAANAQVIRLVLDELRPEFALIDKATVPDIALPHEFIIKGDGKVFSIAAASVIAKVTRDRMMSDFDKEFPGYGFAEHKGYGTAVHQAALTAQGVCPIHRMSFQPISQQKLF